MTETAKLGWVIVYVPDVEAAIGFYEKAFGLERRFVAPDASFGELNTGETRLAFASEQQAESNFEGGFQRPSAQPFNIELALVFDDPDGGLRARRGGRGNRARPNLTRSPGGRWSPTCATRSGRSWSWLRQPTDHR